MTRMTDRIRTATRVLALATLAAVAVPAAGRAEPGDIRGQDVKGDKDKSANDGWSQAPVPREESAAKDAPNPGGRSISENKDRPVPAANPGGTAADLDVWLWHRRDESGLELSGDPALLQGFRAAVAPALT